MRELTKVLKVLSDETRLRVLGLLLERECCVCEVMQALQISQSKASRALSALYASGLLKLRKDGLWSLYSIDRESASEYQLHIINIMEQSLSKSKITIQDREKLHCTERIDSRRECVS